MEHRETQRQSEGSARLCRGVSVAMDRVGLTYQGTPAVLPTDLMIKEGTFVAVVGPSGCGKSSILKLMAGLVPASSGRISIAGKPVNGPLDFAGMAFQNPALLPWRTALGNLLLPLEIVRPYRSKFRRERASYEDDARELLAAAGLAGAEKKYPWMLSGGMQQRVNLCRSLIHKPKLLLLDEPFAALDAFTREDLWAALQRIWLEQRFSAVLVTHDLREAVFLADTVFVMSSSPGSIIGVKQVTLARPRTLETTFLPEFVELVRELRHMIGAALGRAGPVFSPGPAAERML
jgi:NitT/TauT family transport system ATP-binding protein